jgi:hypothetical protein
MLIASDTATIILANELIALSPVANIPGCLMPKIQALPFEITTDSISNWLLSLDQLIPSEKINLLNGALSELAEVPIEKNTLFSMLDKLTDNVLLLSKIMEHNARKAANSPDKARKWMATAIQLPKKLSFAYAQLAHEDALPDAQKAVCAYRAMHILGLLIKRSTLFHEVPDSSLWKKFAQLYLLAEEKQWLALPLSQRTPGMISQPTIEALTKHALLFYACHPHRYEASAIAGIFAAIAELVQHVRLGLDASDAALCHWQPDALLPPDCSDPDNPEQRTLSLQSRDLADFFETHPDQLQKFAAFPGLVDRLTAYYEIRRSVNPLTSKTCGLIIGSATAQKFLNVLISRYRVMELSGMNHGHQKASHWELVPLEIRNTLASLSSKILADVKNVSASQLSVFATKERVFCVTKIAHLECSRDEPAILVQEGKPPCLALIRHIRPDSNIKYKNLLLEKIEGEVYPLETGNNQGFIVVRPSDNERADLFLPANSRYRTATVLPSVRGIIDASLKIEKFVESNMHFTRYEVSFCGST